MNNWRKDSDPQPNTRNLDPLIRLCRDESGQGGYTTQYTRRGQDRSRKIRRAWAGPSADYRDNFGTKGGDKRDSTRVATRNGSR